MITRTRHWPLVLPAILAAVAGLAQGCGAHEAEPRSLVNEEQGLAQKLAAADRQLTRDVAIVAAATTRCSQASATPSCMREATADVASLGPRTLRPQGISDILAQLPVKETICAVVRGLTAPRTPRPTGDDAGADAGKADGGSPSSDGGVADAGAIAPLPSVYAIGGPLTGAPGAVADQVWDSKHRQVAVLTHPKGGVGALAAVTGPYTAVATGEAASVIEAWSGAFALSGDGLHVEKGALVATVTATTVGPIGLPELAGTIAPALVYAPWDAATERLAQALAALQPQVLGGVGAKYIQLAPFTAEPGSGTTNDAVPVAVAMLVSAGDPGDFSSAAGQPALAGVATNIADQLGIGIDAWCGPAPSAGGTGSDGDAGGTGDGTLGGSTCTPYVGDARCTGGSTCSWNGQGFCCRAEPKAVEAEYCSGDQDCVQRHDSTWVCSNRSDDKFVCTPKATCK